MQSNWEGPYLVKERLNELIYRIVRSPKAKPKVVHINRLARFEDPRKPKKIQEQENTRGQEEEKIQEKENERRQEEN